MFIRIMTIACILFTAGAAYADLFKYTLTAFPGQNNEQSYSESFKSIADIFDNLDTDGIEQNITGYDEDTTAANVDIDLRGIPVYLTLAQNSNKIIMRIPAIGLVKEFEGTDRDDSIDEMEDWLESDGGSTVSRLMQKLAEETATDPIAGNPASVQSRMVGMDYGYAVNGDEMIEANQSDMGAKGSINANNISIFARYTNYDLDGVSSTSYALPLVYTVRFDSSKNSLSFRMPIAVVDVDGSKAYNVGLGLGLSYFIKDNWAVTPAVGYTAAGSIDLGSAAQLVSGSLTSAYNFKLNKGLTLTMGNMLGRYETIPFTYKDFSVNPDIKNTVLRNGLNLNIPTDKLSKDTSVELFVLDTRYFGSELYVDQYNEFGISYGFANVKEKKKDDKIKKIMRKMRIGLTYLYSDKATGYSVNFGFSF